MSTAIISYGDLRSASSSATKVAKKLEKYSDTLSSKVYNKLNDYDGSWTSNLSTASNRTNSKITELNAQQSKFETYSVSLSNLETKCREVDVSVKTMVSSLTSSFKASHGIRDSKVENAISNFFTGLGNSTFIGRWLGNAIDERDAKEDYLKSQIKEWYNYDGGKEFLKGSLVACLEVVLGVLSVISAIVAVVGVVTAGVLTGGAVFALIAGVAGIVGGVIATVNGFTNGLNEYAALKTTQGGDPATGRRRSNIDTLQGYLRSSFIFDSSGEKYEYNATYNNLALAIDITNMTCMAIGLLSGIKDLLKNGYKWATNSYSKVKDISLNKVFSKDSLKLFGSKIKSNFSDIGAAIKTRDFSGLKSFGKGLISDFGENFMDEFFNFKTTKDTLSSLKNLISIPKDLIKEGFTLSNIAEVGFESIVLPSLTAFKVNNELKVNTDGQLSWDLDNLYDNITVDKITGIFEKGSKIGDGLSKMGKSKYEINVVNKLSVPSDISISLPSIYIPTIQKPQITVL